MKYVVTLNGKKYEVEVEKVESGFKPLTRAAAAATQVPTSAAPQAPAASGVSAQPPTAEPCVGDCNVISPMPGTVLDIKVSQGERVKAGQTLLVLEAMKMENEIAAPRDATVVSVSVKKGSNVDTDQTLMVLK